MGRKRRSQENESEGGRKQTGEGFTSPSETDDFNRKEGESLAEEAP